MVLRYTRPMSEHDTFFTLSIVGAPQQVVMGRRMRPSDAQTEGLRAALQSDNAVLTRLWREKVLIASGKDLLGVPRPEPGVLRRWLERHALWLAALGLGGMAATALFWGLAWPR